MGAPNCGYHFYAKPVSFGKNESAVHTAAYNARCQLQDERNGKLTKDYGKTKGATLFSGIFAPKNAPAWTQDRERLWNRAEAAERQWDGQPARNIITAFPHQLDPLQCQRMLTDFCREEFARRGMVADASIHPPDPEAENSLNTHAHIMLTMRELDGENFAKTKNRDWNSKQALAGWREKWAELGARYLAKAGYQVEAERWRYAHLKNEQQAEKARERGDMEFAEVKDREPTTHRGPHVDAMENRGMETERGNIYRDTYERGEKLAEQQAQLKTLESEIRNTAAAKPAQGTAREIWEAYHQSDSARAFVAALTERGLRLSIVTEADRPEPKERRDPRDELAQLLSMKANGVWMMATEGAAGLTEKQRDSAERSYDNYQHQHNERPPLQFAEYVAHVQEQNAERLEGLEQQCAMLPPKGKEAKSEQQHAAVYARAGTWVAVNERGYLYYLNERTTGSDAREVQEFLNASLKREAFYSVTENREQIAAQAGWKEHSIDGADLKGPGRDIWEACERSTGGAQLAAELAECGILIARATKEDAQQSQLADMNAQTRGYRATVMKEGEFVAVTRSGDVYRFSDRNTGGRLAEIAGFMPQLPGDAVLSVKATREIMQQVRHSEAMERATRPTGKPWQMGLDNAPLPKALVSQLRSAAFKTVEAAAQILGAAMEGIGNLFGATAMTPERIEAAREQRKQQGFRNEIAAAKQDKIDIERFRRDGDYRREVQAREREKLEQETQRYSDQQKDRERDRR